MFTNVHIFHTFAMDSIRSKLDELMGPNRNGDMKARDITVSCC